MFKEARPVWKKDSDETMNLSLVFKAIIDYKGKVLLRLAGASNYQVYINGKFLTVGPVRAGHGYFRLDEIDISGYLKEENNNLAIIVAGYNINNFYSLDQPSFLQAELEDMESGEIIAYTGSKDKPFYFRDYSERLIKVPKFSFQRAFTEVYNLSKDYNKELASTDLSAYSLAEEVEEKEIIERRLPLYKHPIKGVKSILARGQAKEGIIPSQYIKDRLLENIGPMQKGYTREELENCLIDEVQEIGVKAEPVKENYKGENRLRANEMITFGLENEYTGFISFKVTCLSDAVIYVMFDERLGHNNDVAGLANSCISTIKISLEKGDYDFTSFEPYGFKYIKFLSFKGEVIIRDVHVKEYICSCSLKDIKEIINKKLLQDPKIDLIIDSAINTYKQNALDVFMDCPTRERAGWLCDSFFSARAEKALTGENLIEYNFFENFLLAKDFKFLPKGMLPMCYPADHYDKVFIPNWAMWFIKELYDYSLRNEDARSQKLTMDLKEKVYDLLGYFSKFENEHGLLENLESWVFIEWSKANDFVNGVNFPTNMVYSSALVCAGKLYGDKKMIDKGNKVKDTIIERSYDGQFFVDNEVRIDGTLVSTGQRTETCQYYAFFCDVASPETMKDLWDLLVKEFGPKRDHNKVYPDIYPSNAFIGVVLRLDLLKRYGYREELIEEIKDYFYQMAVATGTLWENLTPNASCNHGFASFVIYLLS